MIGIVLCGGMHVRQTQVSTGMNATYMLQQWSHVHIPFQLEVIGHIAVVTVNSFRKMQLSLLWLATFGKSNCSCYG